MSSIKSKFQSSPDHIKKLYSDLLYNLGGAPLTSENIIPILVRLMELVEKYPNLVGDQKKVLVLDVLEHATEALNTSVDVRIITKNTIPYVIDTIIKATNKDIEGLIHKKEKRSRWWLLC
jgi:hypothetical protein